MHERVFRASEAHKLDAPERRTWMPVGQVIPELSLHSGMTVADIGAGTGYLTLPILHAAEGVAHVYAVDLQSEMLDLLRAKLDGAAAAKVSLIHAPADHTTLARASCDLVLLVNVWHEFQDRGAVLQECRRILRPEARVAILDWRSDVSPEPGPPLAHRIAAGTVTQELKEAGWAVEKNLNVGTYSYLVIAR
jgi:ubiquinone/menaquinone biosynthesis C-methylase UbiE